MDNSNTGQSGWQASQKKNTHHLGYWTLAWVVTMAIANFGGKFVWEGNEWMTGLGILINVAVGFGMILANRRHLKGLDEMQQKIQLGAMGLTLGVGLVLGLAYSNIENNLIIADAGIPHVVMLMCLTYLFGIIAGRKRYK